MDQYKAKEELKIFLKQYNGNREIGDSEAIFGTGLVNSLFAMQLVLYLEKKYGLTIENSDLDIKNFETINAIYEFIKEKNNRSKAS